MWKYNNICYQDNELYHYGVKGMKWGVRKLDKRNGKHYLKKGTTVKRVTTDPLDITYDNKKYVSINPKDHSKWDKYLGKGYANRDQVTFVTSYKTAKDLKVMSSKEQGKKFADMMLNSDFKKQALYDTDMATTKLGVRKSKNKAENISRNIAMQTDTGKKFVQEVMKDHYDALIDTHGKNLAKTPLIVLNPSKNLKPDNKIDVTDYLRKNYSDIDWSEILSELSKNRNKN